MIFDHRVGIERRQFATQVSRIPPEQLKVLKEGFQGKESQEFYEGLLAGYACSFQLTHLPQIRENLGSIVAYLSDILEERS
jgi:hypothetical protein